MQAVQLHHADSRAASINEEAERRDLADIYRLGGFDP
jgi:hypothetical protein